MCGIAGLFDARGQRPFSPSLLRAMTAQIAHRGPDGDGHFLEPGIALGHRRLSIIDPAGGAQPMSLPGGGPTVITNGEIYNFKGLRDELIATGAHFKTNSDTEVLLHGWRAWGEGLVDRLHGMFAFAIWDPSQSVLFLARDRLGKKPLHYCWLADGTLAFGSEIKCLTLVPGVDLSLDAHSVQDFFGFGYVVDPKTIYQGISKLPAATTMLIKQGGVPKFRRYWDVRDEAEKWSDAPIGEDELRAKLGAAVKSRLVSDVEIGAFLSGGVDSSAVVALMAQETAGSANTFSIGFAERKYDETAYAEAVARRYETNHSSLQVTSDGIELLDRLPQIFDEPFGDPSSVPTFFVCEQTAKHVKVCLSGDGGDEALAGYRRYQFHMAGERLRSVLPASVREPVFGTAGALYPKLDWMPRIFRAKTTFQELSTSSARSYYQMLSVLPDSLRTGLFSPDGLDASSGYTPLSRVEDLYSRHSDLDALQKAQYTDLNLYLVNDILTKVDRTSMANSLEVRAPFLDHEFVGWAFGLPARAKLSGSNGKAILKRAMEPLLPRDLLYRPKQGFEMPISEWLRGPLRSAANSLPDSPELRASGLFDVEQIRSRVGAHMSGQKNHLMSIWLVMVFDAFLKNQQESVQPAPAGQFVAAG